MKWALCLQVSTDTGFDIPSIKRFASKKLIKLVNLKGVLGQIEKGKNSNFLSEMQLYRG